MSNLVERLRDFPISDELGDGDFSVCLEAADEIEEIAKESEARGRHVVRVLLPKIERLRALLEYVYLHGVDDYWITEDEGRDWATKCQLEVSDGL